MKHNKLNHYSSTSTTDRADSSYHVRWRLSYETRFALVMSLMSILLLVGLSCVFSPTHDTDTQPLPVVSSPNTITKNRLLEDNNNNNNNEDDYSSYSCHLIHELTTKGSDEQCRFAKTCGGGEGVWAPIVFCDSSRSRLWTGILAPFMTLWMVVLFRLLGSTAEDYFSPSLEMFSTQLGLPPRFAGVTLLALGNGAADVSATISAITGDANRGYQLSLGALTGAAMMIGCVVSALVILTAEGVPCRGALVRDVTALLVTVLVVWRCLSSGKVTPETITIFLSLYCVFVMIVLVADVYHRRVVMPRMAAEAQELERQRQMNQAQDAQQRFSRASAASSAPADSRLSHVLTALSNYDQNEVIGGTNDNGGWGVESEVLQQDRPILLHGSHGILSSHPHHHQHQTTVPTEEGLPTNTSNNRTSTTDYSVLEESPEATGLMMDSNSNYAGMMTMLTPSSFGPIPPYQSFHSFLEQVRAELIQHFNAVWDDIYWNGDVNILEKFLLTVELPFTILRQCTVAIPCEGFYERSLVALALLLSPTWMAYYLWRSNEVNIFLYWQYYIYWGVLLLIALSFCRLAPVQDNNSLSPWVTVPIALYGFAMAATWIDTIADSLVSLLNFIGVLLGIPSSVLGLTLLAWGNSMSDLSANMTMARKGLANMAMTACFAGPVFNILVGLGLGFSSLAARSGQPEREVELSPSVLTGFAFVATNCLCILVTGVFLCQARIPRTYGYVSLTLYAIYVITSITLQYSKFGGDDNSDGR